MLPNRRVSLSLYAKGFKEGDVPMIKIAKHTACAVWCGKTMVDGRSGSSVYWPDIVWVERTDYVW